MFTALMFAAALTANHPEITSETLACKEGDKLYFVKPEGFRYILKGFNGAPNMIIFQDTNGKLHKFSGAEKAVCVNAGNGVNI